MFNLIYKHGLNPLVGECIGDDPDCSVGKIKKSRESIFFGSWIVGRRESVLNFPNRRSSTGYVRNR